MAARKETPEQRAEGWQNLENRVRYLIQTLTNIREMNVTVADAPVSLRSSFALLEQELEKWGQVLTVT